MDIKQNITNRDVWLRGLFIVIFGVILYFAFILHPCLVIGRLSICQQGRDG